MQKANSFEMKEVAKDSGAIRFLEGWQRLIAAMERTLVDNVAATVPWLSPVPSAVMAYQNVSLAFGWYGWIGGVVAAVVEGLGLAVTSTAFTLWDWNDSNDEKHYIPLFVAVIALVFYLFVVITLNVILDVEATAKERTAKALLSLLPLVGSVTLALRAQHARRLEKKLQAEAQAQKIIDDQRQAIENEKESEFNREQRKLDAELRRELKLQKASAGGAGSLKVSAKVSESISDVSETYGKWKTWIQVPPAEKAKIWDQVKVLAKPESMRWIVKTYGTSERVAYQWIDYAVRDFGKQVM